MFKINIPIFSPDKCITEVIPNPAKKPVPTLIKFMLSLSKYA